MLLDVNGLAVEYETNEGQLRAVDDVTFSLDEGETLGIVGESGCGKTTVAKSLLKILPDNGQYADGSINYRGTDIMPMDESEFRSYRWNEIAYIIQNAMNALDPVHKVGNQLIEVIRVHSDTSRKEAKERTVELFERVGLDKGRINDYPHELSGGQKQRAVIALALALNPSLIVADEITTGLDVIVQNEVLDLINEIQNDMGSAMIFVSHDINVVEEVADRVAVMYGGRIMELGDTDEVFQKAAHPYTLGLLHSFPSLERDQSLVSIPGQPPNLLNPPSGCRFKARCPFATEECNNVEPPIDSISNDHITKCHYTEKANEFRNKSQDRTIWGEANE